MTAPTRIASFRARLQARELLVGTFLKTPSAAIAEILGLSGLNCLCVDAEHAPAYLESTKPENVPYYQRFGFTVTGEIVLPDGGPTMWAMWRPPR